MPVGVMQWFDDKTGEGRVVRRGHAYPTSLADHVETHARVPGVRVHFDVSRRDGIERAANVSAEVGTRTSHRHRRHGDQSGAHDSVANSPGKTERFTELGLDRERRPRRVVLELLRRLADGELAVARPLLAPDIVLHRGDAEVRGTDAVFDVLAESPLSGGASFPVNVTFVESAITVDWMQEGGGFFRAILRVQRGEVKEIWWDVDHSQEASGVGAAEHASTGPPMQVVISGHVPRRCVEYGRKKLGAVMSHLPGPVLFARLKLVQHADPAATRPSSAEAFFDLEGQLLRARAAGDTMTEAVDILERRLLDRVGHARRTGGDERVLHNQATRIRSAETARPTRPGRYRKAAEESEVVRRKTIADEPMTRDEALWDLEQLDYDFYLFADLETGTDAVISLTGDGKAVVREFADAPQLEVAQAKEWLDTVDEAFLFFAGADGRGQVLYRRADGDYGLLTT